MQNMSDFKELFRLAQTPAGRELITLLQKNGGSRLSDAISKAASGDYAQAKSILSELLSTPEAQALLRQLEEKT